MGDRANIYLELPTGYAPDSPKGGVYLYTHWNGSEWPERLREALAFGANRWTDDQYLARIITSRVFADLVDGEMGGGLSLALGDNSHPIIVVEVADQTVSFADEDDETDRDKRYGRVSFAEYVAQVRASYPARAPHLT
ncbi:MAG TPA: hypothetical protein VGH76_15270 [Actinomycetospora sp.]|jgi:hypothetical protein|uniref:hypothetical protein n=1 Tax=Actinomycetospora sp. TaxID=1872135 RepID=UPI002F3F1B39